MDKTTLHRHSENVGAQPTMTRYKIRLKVPAGEAGYDEKYREAQKLLFSVDPAKIVSLTKDRQTKSVPVNEILAEDLVSARSHKSRQRYGGDISHRGDAGHVRPSEAFACLRKFTNYTVNDWYHLPHPTLVLVPAVCRSNGNGVTYPEFNCRAEGGKKDANETVLVDEVYAIKCRVRHRVLNGGPPWFSDKLETYEDVYNLLATTMPIDIIQSSFEYLHSWTDPDLLYMIRRCVEKQRITWTRISHKIIMSLANPALLSETNDELPLAQFNNPQRKRQG
ncbi:hypothetical protein GNI_061550 [Gregarina niphandrodes]|uniref:Uncharacterized protein n=1 Tax=Gregarina niphandrodes TaxID=110365 RepID=A0A023B8C6_GRENI|nr:hypothetical protein GNI_061550 [Gregarina niphandrodes]EZG68710.1 hypothetical protein GNI_061550 [Gregarina niphandrodes]|eukprot:XP_011134554.1 hypothetical protein GNI_061550 [Gregarina niphandrodes]